MVKNRILKELSDFISIQSVSSDPQRLPEMNKAVDFLQSKLKLIGFRVEVLKNHNSPAMIYAEYKVKNARKTIGIYGHYDVQPEDPVDEWSVPPFELTQKDGRLYGRGVADNKGHVMQNITAIEELISSQSLKSNIIFIIEGEEECGSESFEKYMQLKKTALDSVDVYYITDVGMHAKHIPQIIYALRGLVYFELTVEIGKRDLHSGVYGNSVLNPAQILAELLVRMKDIKTGVIQIPGFSDDVRAVDPSERKLLMKNSLTDTAFAKETETYTVISMQGLPSFLAPKLFPSLDVHGIESGFTGSGPKTIIPRQARMKFSCRLVEYQTAADIRTKVYQFIQRNMPQGVQYNLQAISYDDPFYTTIENKYIQKTARILSSHFGNETILMREGGSVPAAEIIQRLFQKPVILTGFILPESNLHAPDENVDREMFWEGIEVLKKIYGDTNF